jgi:hypothetical protein
VSLYRFPNLTQPNTKGAPSLSRTLRQGGKRNSQSGTPTSQLRLQFLPISKSHPTKHKGCPILSRTLRQGGKRNSQPGTPGTSLAATDFQISPNQTKRVPHPIAHFAIGWETKLSIRHPPSRPSLRSISTNTIIAPSPTKPPHPFDNLPSRHVISNFCPSFTSNLVEVQ